MSKAKVEQELQIYLYMYNHTLWHHAADPKRRQQLLHDLIWSEIEGMGWDLTCCHDTDAPEQDPGVFLPYYSYYSLDEACVSHTVVWQHCHHSCLKDSESNVAYINTAQCAPYGKCICPSNLQQILGWGKSFSPKAVHILGIIVSSMTFLACFHCMLLIATWSCISYRAMVGWLEILYCHKYSRLEQCAKVWGILSSSTCTIHC